jgi:chromosome segregation ATPase
MSAMLDRLFVDRHVYERRPSGGHVVTFTRRAQLGAACLMILLLVLCLGLGVAIGNRWPGVDRLVRYAAYSPPATSALVMPAASGRITDLTVRLKALQARNDDLAHQLELAKGSAATASRADEASGEIATLRAQLAQATAERANPADALRLAQAKTAAQDPAVAATSPTADANEPGATPKGPEAVELAVVRRERDAARQQLDSLMASATKLKAELDQQKAKAKVKAGGAAPEPAAAPPAAAAHVTQLQGDVDQMEQAVKSITEQLVAEKREAAARESELEKKLGQARFEQQAAVAERDGLRQRVAQLSTAAGGGPSDAGDVVAQPAALTSGQGEEATLRAQLRAALARLMTLDPAFAERLEHGQPATASSEMSTPGPAPR